MNSWLIEHEAKEDEYQENQKEEGTSGLG